MASGERSRLRKKLLRYDFDVALSYAGEDRNVAKRLARALQRGGFGVFFDKDSKAVIWGKRAEYFEHVYGPGSRYVIPLLSEHYRNKEWCQFELDVACKEAKRRRDEFLLPVRLDGTRQPGIFPDCFYADLREDSIPTLVNMLKQKVTELENQQSAGSLLRQGKGESPARPVVLDTRRRELLGLLAMSMLPTSASVMQKLFPQYNWGREFNFFRSKGLLSGNGNRAHVPLRIKKTLLVDPAERKRFNEQWIIALTPLADHPDTALALSAHLMHMGAHSGSVKILTNIALALDSGIWNSIYLEILQTMEERLPTRLLDSETRAELLNALGICLCRAGEHLEGLKCLTALRVYARRTRNRWAIAQALINSGVALYHLRDQIGAERMYRRSINYARGVGDKVVYARSLGNLSQLLMQTNPRLAKDLLEQSLEIKKKVGDVHGIVGGYLTLGNLFVREGDISSARKWYERAAKAAKRLDLRYEESLALINIGNVELDLGNDKLALSSYVRADKISSQEHFHDAFALSLRNQATLHARFGRFGKSEILLRKLELAHRQSGGFFQQAVAIHDIGAVLINRGQFRRGRLEIKRAMRLAAKMKEPGLLYQSHLVYGLSFITEGKVEKGLTSFAQSAKDFVPSNPNLAASLLLQAAEVAARNLPCQSGSLKYYRSAANYLSRISKPSIESVRLKAICSSALGDSLAQRRHWRLCHRLALRQEDHSAAFEATIELARISLGSRNLKSALQYVRAAGSHVSQQSEDIERLSLEMDILLLRGQRREAMIVFARACRICRKFDYSAECVDLHMKMGDYYWGLRANSQFTALKAYTAGLAEALKLGENVIFQVGSHIILRLYRMRFEGKEQRLEYLQAKLQKWLQNKVTGTSNKRLVNWLLWPFRVALRLAADNEHPDCISAQDIQSVLVNEVQSWLSYQVARPGTDKMTNVPR